MQVYFDNAATTPLHPKVLEKMLPFFTEQFGNPSSIHLFGRRARVAIEEARETVAAFINANPSEIYFTSGGTESNNFIIRGIAQTEFLESGRNKIITSKTEHYSALDSVLYLTTQGFHSKFIEANFDTSIEIESLQDEIDNQTSLLSFIHINNETGAANPIDKISSLIKSKNIFLHTDAVQSFGKINIDVAKLGVHSLSASAHKINGPKGTGIAYVKSGTPLSSLIIGGSQERNRRGGTENIAGIVGMAAAIQIAEKEMNYNYEHVQNLRNKFINGINSIDKSNIKINGGINSSPYILSITFLSDFYKNDAEAMLMYLDINGVAVSNGAACSSGTLKPSHVILSAGYSEADASGTFRFSFGVQNTIQEVEYALEVLKKMAIKFRI